MNVPYTFYVYLKLPQITCFLHFETAFTTQDLNLRAHKYQPEFGYLSAFL